MNIRNLLETHLPDAYRECCDTIATLEEKLAAAKAEEQWLCSTFTPKLAESRAGVFGVPTRR